jgi:prepilin-type N-terminal cleavage/methylation domain-containing protein
MKSFTPLESPYRYKDSLLRDGDNITEMKSPYKRDRFKALSFLTGVTLIELVMVIVVLAILASTWVVISLGPNKLIGASNKLMSDLRYAQQLAISRQVYCGASFNISGNSYFVYIGTTSTKATDPYSGGDLSVDYDTASEYKGVALSSTNFGDRIYFDYMGRPYDNSDVLLSSQGAVILHLGSYSNTVQIEPNTGQVKVQ